jgi:hypothetical protein
MAPTEFEQALPALVTDSRLTLWAIHRATNGSRPAGAMICHRDGISQVASENHFVRQIHNADANIGERIYGRNLNRPPIVHEAYVIDLVIYA